MNYKFDSRLGEQLYQLLPEVYHTRDKMPGPAGGGSGKEDLARYLDAHGHLLDLIHATLEQQLRDILPESCQDWLLPYFAQLLAAKIVSPDSAGRHAEITHAVSWRQRKGTLKCVEEIAEAVGQMEVEIQEGWKRVAMTPRIGMPLMPARVWDDTLDIDLTVPSEAARHPALPAATVDLRRPSRAVETLPTNPAARVSNFGGIPQTWRQMNLHGAPCFPGSFDDVSRRTVDIRTPDAAHGHYHHKRLLACAPPPAGLFPFDPIHLTWDERRDSLYEHLIEEKDQNGVWLIRNKTDRIIEIVDDVTLSPARPYRVEGLNFKTKLSVTAGGRLELYRVEAVKVQVDTFSIDEPVLTANDCLFNELSVGSGTARLESCTILETAYLSDIDAVDCIFMDMTGTSISGAVQYSRIPVQPPISAEKMTIEDSTTAVPVFFGGRIKYDIDNKKDHNGAGVLLPVCSEEIYAGASDGGEMGYFHHGRKGRPVRIAGIYSFDLPDAGGYPLEDLIFENAVKVTSGTMILRRAAVRELTVETGDGNSLPGLDAKDCLFDIVNNSIGLTRMEYCTVMKTADCINLLASDCLFADKITGGSGNEPESGCMRYSRIPADFVGHALNVHPGPTDTNTRTRAVFNEFSYCEDPVAIRDLAIDPNDSDIMFAGTHGGGVLKSVDAGNSWLAQNTDLTDLNVRALAIGPNDPAIIYAGTHGGGVFRWEQSSESWIERNNGLAGPFGRYVQALAVDPNDSDIIYTGTHGSGVFKSADAGNSWLAQNTDLTDLDVRALAIDPNDPAIIYAGTHGGGVFRWEQSSESWAERNNGLADPYGRYVQALAVDPDNSDIIYAGTHGSGVFKSEHGGLNWAEMNTGLTDLNVQVLAIDPDDPAIIYAGTRGGGVFRWDKNERSWAERNNGLTDLNVQALAVDPDDAEIIYAGTYGGGVFKSEDGGGEWSQKMATINRKKSVCRQARFGETGYGVLNPVTPDAIRFGAEDGGEMGACHHKYYSLKAEAVLDKMREYLPVGIEPVLVQDTRLLHVPPEHTIPEEPAGNGGNHENRDFQG